MQSDTNGEKTPKKATQGLKIVYICIIIAAAIIACFAVKNALPAGDSVNVTIDLYYADRTTGMLKSEQGAFEAEDEEELLRRAFDKLKTQPKNELLASAVPSDVELKSIKFMGSTVVLDVSPEYGELLASDEIICRAAIVWTLTGFDFVDSVEIKISGAPLAKSDGTPMGTMGREDIVIDPIIPNEPVNTVEVVLYFSNAEATGLIEEIRSIEVNPNMPLEKYVMEQLILGPAIEDAYPTIPSGTKIKNITTLDGVCYVDLNSDFVSKHSGGSAGELLTVFSIVNSLCELDNINKVQFLIEGEKQEEFKGHIIFSDPFSPMEVKL